jgi:hypothetical protein
MSGSGTSRRFDVRRNFVAIGNSGLWQAGRRADLWVHEPSAFTGNGKREEQRAGHWLRIVFSDRLSDAITVAMRLGYRLLDFPEHPDDGRSQTDHDTQEHQRQSRGCEHVQHP